MSKLSGERLVALAKLDAYLLDLTHPIGRTKAAFFLAHGFDRGRSLDMIQALLRHADDNQLVAVTTTDHGEKSIVMCRIATPDGRDPCIRTVWLREHGTDVHRLVTAYPAKVDSSEDQA